MSQSQQQQLQEQQTRTACKHKKRKHRRKHTQGNELSLNCEQKDQVGAANENKPIARKNPLQTTTEHLQMAQKPTTSIVSRKAAGSNWETVAKSNDQIKQNTNKQKNVDVKGEENSENNSLTKSARQRQKRRAAEEKYVAMDCEMVGVGFKGRNDMLARVSIVSKRGEVLLDKFVKPQEVVTNYRTSVSGIRPHNINNAEDFESVQDEVVQILQGKILIGHAICKDLAVLRIKHPPKNIRDTSRYEPLRLLVANGHTPSLKRLSQAILGKEIQIGEHNSVEDARATMSIYNLLSKDWEAYIKRHQHKTEK